VPARPSNPRWRVRLLSDPLGIHSWHVVTGLTMLAHAGEVDLRFVSRPSRSVPPHRQAPWLDVDDLETGDSWGVCIDLADGPELSGGRPALADAVFKRSLDRSEVPGWLADRVHPYGLSYRCRSGLEGLMVGQSLRSLPRAASPTLARARSRSSRMKLALWPLTQPVNLERVRRRPGHNIPGIPRLVHQFEVPPSEPAEPLVLFQTRTWPRSETGQSHRHATNEQRVELVRILRRPASERAGPTRLPGRDHRSARRSDRVPGARPSLRHRGVHARAVRVQPGAAR
jgi:hypothetical protein